MNNNRLSYALVGLFLSSSATIDTNAGVTDAAARTAIRCAVTEQCRDVITGSPKEDQRVSEAMKATPLDPNEFRPGSKIPNFQRTLEQHNSAAEVRRAFEQNKKIPVLQFNGQHNLPNNTVNNSDSANPPKGTVHYYDINSGFPRPTAPVIPTTPSPE